VAIVNPFSIAREGAKIECAHRVDRGLPSTFRAEPAQARVLIRTLRGLETRASHALERLVVPRVGHPHTVARFAPRRFQDKLASCMQLNAFTDYSLRVLIYATVRSGERCLTSDVASAFGISRHHVVKVVHRLQALGYLETTRGRTGGFRLAQAPGEIRVGDVVRRTEGTLALVECFAREQNTCPLAPACGLKGVLRDAFDAFFDTLNQSTIADLVARPQWVSRMKRLDASFTSRQARGDAPRQARGDARKGARRSSKSEQPAPGFA
jgi:Rrf2 family nitric oxide-sensitive transcriptional repressor